MRDGFWAAISAFLRIWHHWRLFSVFRLFIPLVQEDSHRHSLAACYGLSIPGSRWLHNSSCWERVDEDLISPLNLKRLSTLLPKLLAMLGVLNEKKNRTRLSLETFNILIFAASTDASFVGLEVVLDYLAWKLGRAKLSSLFCLSLLETGWGFYWIAINVLPLISDACQTFRLPFNYLNLLFSPVIILFGNELVNELLVDPSDFAMEQVITNSPAHPA